MQTGDAIDGIPPHARALECCYLCTYAIMLVLTAFTCVQQHRFTYNEPMPVESTTQSLCDLALRFGEDSEGSMVSSTAGAGQWRY
jgi:hypothetical protein